MTAATLVLPARGFAAAPATLTAGPVEAAILGEGEGLTRMLGFNGTTPGPELRARQGETLSLTFQNRMGGGSAVHWHGIRIDNAMDGVPDLTQPMVEDGADFAYSFRLPDAGTYWYHSHARSWEQVEQGLYGPLIVEETTPPAVDHDVTVMIDDWRLQEDGTLVGGFGNMHDMAHAGRLGNFARAIPSVSEVRRGDRLRLRLINAATARVFDLRVSGIRGMIVALDGMPLAAPQEAGDLTLAPAQRADLLVDVTGPVVFDLMGPPEPYELGRIETAGENTAPISAPIAALPAPDVARPKDQPDHALVMRLQGGAMGGRHGGEDIWALNDHSGMEGDPFGRFARGETARITLVNQTAFPHGMHLHGHHFHEVGADGTLGPLRDTTLVQPHETRDIVAVLDNPGKWLIHCHMLEHQAAGMKTWIEVA